MVKTDVECPNCQARLCNLCAFNGACEDCGQRLSRAVKTRVISYLASRDAARDGEPELSSHPRLRAIQGAAAKAGMPINFVDITDQIQFKAGDDE